MEAVDFIEKGLRARRQPFYVLSGDDEFLKRRSLQLIQAIVLGEADPEYSVTTFDGTELDFSRVRNELFSGSFFSDRRLVVVNQGEKFLKNHRSKMEQYIADPAPNGVLVLDLPSLPSNTRFAQAVPELAHIVCVSPKAYRLPRWAVNWCEVQYGKTLNKAASELLVEYVGPVMGVIDQELQKLRDAVGDRATIEVKDVQELVGKSPSADVFKIMDAVGEGNATRAMKILTDVLDTRDDYLMVLGALTYTLRRVAKAARLHKQGMGMDEALIRSGINQFSQETARKVMRHLGWNRLDRLYDWILEMQSALKGGSPLPERLLLERFVVRLARPRAG